MSAPFWLGYSPACLRAAPFLAGCKHALQGQHKPLLASSEHQAPTPTYWLQVLSIPLHSWSDQTLSKSKLGQQRSATLPKIPSLLFDIEVGSPPRQPRSSHSGPKSLRLSVLIARLVQLEERAARSHPQVEEASVLVLGKLTKLVEPRTHLEDMVSRSPAHATLPGHFLGQHLAVGTVQTRLQAAPLQSGPLKQAPGLKALLHSRA